MKNLLNVLALGLLMTFSCNSNPTATDENAPENNIDHYGRVFNLPATQVMVLATFHFRNSNQYEVLEPNNQFLIDSLLNQLAVFAPTKVILEWQPKNAQEANENYRNYLKNEFDINERENEGYQLGFKMAQKMKHDQLFLFDNQTEFIGSLENFSFESFEKYGLENDNGFYNEYDSLLSVIFNENQAISDTLNLYDYISFLNSPNNNHFNAQRMHLREVKVGVQENWLGPDWLGRWYQRNVRMFANVLAMNNHPDDRLLIIVGDNHKWILDMLFAFSAEFELIQPYQYLQNHSSKDQ